MQGWIVLFAGTKRDFSCLLHKLRLFTNKPPLSAGSRSNHFSWFSSNPLHKKKKTFVFSFNMVGRGGLSCSPALNEISVVCFINFVYSQTSLHSLPAHARTTFRGSHPIPCIKKRRLSSSLLIWWAGVDSNHRRLAPTDLQSVPFSHSGTYPYSFNLPLMGFEPMASPLPRECATPAPQRLIPSKLMQFSSTLSILLPRECCYPPPLQQYSIVVRGPATKAHYLQSLYYFQKR